MAKTRSVETSEKIYIVIQEDRQTDTEVTAFHAKADAIAHALNVATDSARGDEVPVVRRLTQSMERDGWVYLIKYSSDGSRVRVIERPCTFPKLSPKGGMT